ncbi:MAG: hypothetical protein RTU92_05260 [Candidatus Thorarchaeota archaeon]
MSNNLINEQLEMLGVTLTSRDMLVVKAILQAQSGSSELVSFDQLYNQIGDTSDRDLTKTWVYQCLSNLEENGFIVIDSITRPRRYMATTETITEGLNRARQAKHIAIVNDIEQIDKRIEFLNELDIMTAASNFHDALLGRDRAEVLKAAETTEEVRKMIIEYLCANSKENDTLRIIDRPGRLDEGGFQSGTTEQAIIEIAGRGGKVQVILLVTKDLTAEFQNMSDYLSNIEGPVLQALMSGQIQSRVVVRDENTYRMLTLNDEKMVLILTDLSFPDKASFITKEENPLLIDDALRVFDDLWQSGKDFKNLFRDSKESSGDN